MNDVLLKKLEELQDKKFMLSMVDHWSYKDSERDRELACEIAEVKKQLKEQGVEI